MLKQLGTILLSAVILSGCSYFNMNNSSSADKYSRCKELRRQMIYTSSNSNQMGGEFSNNLNTNNQMIGATNTAIQGNLNREYRELGC